MWRHARRECLFDFGYRGLRNLLQQFGRFDHHPVLTKSALRSLFCNPGFLYGVKRFRGLFRRQAPLLGPSRGKTI
jgi:hypothetical protein